MWRTTGTNDCLIQSPPLASPEISVRPASILCTMLLQAARNGECLVQLALHGPHTLSMILLPDAPALVLESPVPESRVSEVRGRLDTPSPPDDAALAALAAKLSRCNLQQHRRASMAAAVRPHGNMWKDPACTLPATAASACCADAATPSHSPEDSLCRGRHTEQQESTLCRCSAALCEDPTLEHQQSRIWAAVRVAKLELCSNPMMGASRCATACAAAAAVLQASRKPE